MSTKEIEVPNDRETAIEITGTNVAMNLDTLEEMASDIDELVDALDDMRDMSTEVEQFADALRELDADLHRHVGVLRKIMASMFVEDEAALFTPDLHQYRPQKPDAK
jgi:hypothetical protein